MVDYVKVATAGTTNLAATNAWTPTGVPASVTNDTATFNATSLGGSLSGNFTTRRLSFNGATAAVTHSGTITLGADGLQFGTTNTLNWSQSGTIAVGAINQTWSIFTGSGFVIFSNVTANLGLTGTGNITIDNADSTAVTAQRIWFQGPNTAYTGTITLDNYVSFYMSNGASTGANFIVSGVKNAFIPAVATGVVFGGAGKTLTINNDVELSLAGRTFTIAPTVVLGSVARTLTMLGSAGITGSVTGSAGITLAGDTHYRNLTLPSGLLTGLSGAATLTGGGLDVPAGSWTPTAISVGSNSRFRFTSGTSDYSFPRTPTGAGIVSIGGTFAGNGVTFPASPTEGNIGSFTGSVEAYSASGGNSKVRISELPGGLRLVGFAQLTSNPQATITYLGSGHSGATTLVIDSEDNTQTANLTAGTYSLLSSGAGPIVLSGIVQRTNSNAGVTPLPASARMNLTLGGSNTGDNTLSGDISEASATATLGITKADAGRWVLSGANSSHTGIHTISGGTLSAQSEKALGSATSTGGVFISGSGALELAGSITLDKSVTDFTVSNATNPIQSVGTNQLLTKQLTLSTTPTLTITSGNKLTLSPQGSGVIAGANGITKAGDGELELTAKANTYNGTVTVSAGTLTVGSVANSGSPGAWGQGSSAVEVTGTLRYNGSGGSTTRSVRMNGTGTPTIDASGTSALFLSSVTQDTNAKTMVLRGTNTDANTVSSNIADNIGAVSLEKLDGGKWALAGGTLSYTGTTTVSGGTLRVETANSNTTSGAVTIGASGTVELITDTLASSGATAGEVLGTGNVTVNGGTIKTRGGTTQKGQVRYGGNLTFGAGSSLYIGAAA
jgi:fibronectin-binding autotransporter adhesin